MTTDRDILDAFTKADDPQLIRDLAAIVWHERWTSLEFGKALRELALSSPVEPSGMALRVFRAFEQTNYSPDQVADLLERFAANMEAAE